MKKSRFTEEQIIGFIKQSEAGMPIKSCAARAASATPPSTSGGPSSAEWRSPTLSGCVSWRARTQS
jgi:hypothetical protein